MSNNYSLREVERFMNETGGGESDGTRNLYSKKHLTNELLPNSMAAGE